MANLPAKIRTPLFGLALLAFLLLPTQANAEYLKVKVNKKGSNQGLLNEDPNWAAGVEFGAYRATGIGVQRMGFGSGSLNLAAGFVFGEMALQANYALYLTTDFEFARMVARKKFQQYRGQLLMYGAPGGILGDGMSLYLPVGLQYLMRKDPISYFAELGMTVGPFSGDADNENNISWALGIRVLL